MSQGLLIRFGKTCEHFVRQMRPWLLPRYRRAYAELLARGYRPPVSPRPIVCCDFADRAIDSVGGRYYFSLVKDLIEAGFYVVFTARRVTLSTFGVYWMKKLLLKERFGVIRSLEELKEPFWLITDRSEGAPRNAEMVVRVSYERRLCREDHEIAFPVFVHPQIAARERLPFNYKIDEHRTTRIFFGGNTEQGKYDKDVISEVYHILSRREMLAETMAALEPEMIHRPDDALTWISSSDFYPFVLCETQHCKIPEEQWLKALAKADFFLACPGVDMPLCHNLIEALATGTIPILQYADYLPPPLTDGVNCLTFTDGASLNKLITQVLNMSAAQIRILREGVREYYREYLAPGRFAERLFFDSYSERLLLINAYRVPRS